MSTHPIAALREQVWQRGYRPMAVYSWDFQEPAPAPGKKSGPSRAGKAPYGLQWQLGARLDPPEVVNLGTVVSWAENTGVLCDGLRAIDLDIDDAALVEQAVRLAFDMLSVTIIRTRDNSPRCLLVYRAAEGEPAKLTLVGADGKIEVLGKGQQFVAYGKHPSGAELEWQSGGPTELALADIPAVTEDQINRFLNACAPVIKAQPVEVKKPKANGHDHTAPATAALIDIAAALALVPNGDMPDWESWNNVGLAIYAATAGSEAGWELWRDWSAKNPADDPDATLARWEHYAKSPPDRTGAGKLFAMAAAASPGWRQPSTLRARTNGSHGPVPGVPPVGEPDKPDHKPDKPDGQPDKPDPPDDEPPDPPGDDGPSGRPVPPEIPTITCIAGELPRMVRQAEAALLAAGVEVYQRHKLVRPVEEEYPAADGRITHSAALLAYTPASMLKLLSEVAVWLKPRSRGTGMTVCNPPDKLVQILLDGKGDWTFPHIRGVLTCPTLRYDGSVLKDKGYDTTSRYYLALPSDLVMPEMPEVPTRADAAIALSRLSGLLVRFPFVDAVSKAVAFAILMTQVLRCAMQVSPMLAVSATAPSSGKSFLVDLASAIALGRPCPVIPPGKNEEETEKGIRTKLLSGTPAFSIDNVYGGINMPLLNMATERTHISIRLFSVLEEVEVENSVVIYSTGNNMPIVDEQGRRTIRCCLDSGEERPEFRVFDVNPIDTVMADRGRYIADVLIIARAFLAHLAAGGQRPDIPPMGDSHKTWSKLVREPLVWLGQEDPIKSQELTRQDDPVATRLGALIDAWHLAFGMEEKTLAEATKYATTIPVFMADRQDKDQNDINLAAYNTHREYQEGLLAALRDGFAAGKDGVNTHAWGNWMRKFEGRMSGGMKFVRAEGKLLHGTAKWKLAKA